MQLCFREAALKTLGDVLGVELVPLVAWQFLLWGLPGLQESSNKNLDVRI